MRTSGLASRPTRADHLPALTGSLLGLLLVGASAAALTRALVDLIDGDIRWLPLALGLTGCILGPVVFLRASRPYVQPGPGGVGGVARYGAAAVAIALGIGTSLVAAVGSVPLLSGLASEEACGGLAGILCHIQGEVGGAVAGLMLGARGAQAVLRGRWEILVVLVAVATVEGIVLAARQLSA